MAAIVWSDVVAFEPLVSTVANAAQTAILAYVNTHTNVQAFDGEDGADTRLARIFLAAHLGLGAVPGTGGGVGGGPVASISGGDGLAISYAVTASATSGAALGETAWGRKYTDLVRRTPGARAWIVL